MKRLANIVIGIFIAIVILAIVVPTAGYVMLSTKWSQEHLRSVAQDALENALGTPISIGKVDFQPFNRLHIRNVAITDDFGNQSFNIADIDARVELADFIFTGKMAVDYAVVDGLKAKLYRYAPDGPSNISKIVEKLSSKEKKENKARFEFRLDNIQLLRSDISYDILSEPVDSDRFSTSHIAISDVNVFVIAPVLSNDAYSVKLKHLNFAERSGFVVENVSVALQLTQEQLSVSDFNLQLPNSLLAFDDINVPIQGIESVRKVGTEYPVNIEIKEGSHVFLPDLKAFNPALDRFDDAFMIELKAGGIADSICIDRFSLDDGAGCISTNLSGTLINIKDIKNASLHDVDFNAHLCQTPVRSLIQTYGQSISAKVRDIIRNTGNVSIHASLDGALEMCHLSVAAYTGIGKVDLHGNAGYNGHAIKSNITSDITNLDLGKLLQIDDLGLLSAEISANGYVAGHDIVGQASIFADKFQFKGYNYTGIGIDANSSKEFRKLNLTCDDPNAKIDLSAAVSMAANNKIDGISLNLSADDVRLDSLKITDKYPGFGLSFDSSINSTGESLRKFKALLSLDRLLFTDNTDTLKIRHFELEADNTTPNFNEISIKSDFLNGELEGKYDPLNVWPNVRDLVCEIFPIFAEKLGYYKDVDFDTSNEFAFDFTISNADNISRFFNFPVCLTDPIYITGELSQERSVFDVMIDAPWLLKGDKVIEAATALISIDSYEGIMDIYASALMPTQKGPMTLVANITGEDNQLITIVDWEIDRDNPINGKFEIDTKLKTLDDNKLAAVVQFRPGDINFGAEAWKIQSSDIVISDKHVDIDKFEMHCKGQDVEISGSVGENPDDKLLVSLNNLQLINIFETLNIDNALICGFATGDIAVSDLLTKTPCIVSNNLEVKDIGYNYCVIGDGKIKAWFDNEKEAFAFDADIINPQNRVSRIVGSITPATEELDLNFYADKVKVGFMQPFMKAFCSQVDGYASGKAHLYGTFKYIDMEGDIYADSLRVKIDFTNTWYSTSDSLHIRPGKIQIDDVTLRDSYGHTATLNGTVWHEFFKKPSFDFKISNARDFLCYDTKKENNEIWYGRIFGNGSASVKGYPGHVSIVASMTTTSNSIFTFELSDMQVAEEYQFITFRDKTPVPEVVDTILEVAVPIRAQQIAQKLIKDDTEEDITTAFTLDINVDITPQAKLELVMDPIGGDKISCNGNGHMRLTYNSSDNAIGMLGEYTLDTGSYGFTLQDIIYRDFKIAQGSKITFTGDPYDGNLDIKATYTVNANLSDLDESFLNDKELNRTNVPVNAVMKVTGKMTQPDIAFDLSFPTLSNDIDRKVHSIVSTDDMMNMQIIYLLALNRFYTPDYMSTTKGNELFSVASSTISSQLSSMLGKLSDNWSIAPNLRSDRGDFSDLEVDLTLQSNLLNNRLLLNGNLGYRDKSLNTNQFIGDFDVEYLLNRPGTLRLKAYNRYNDQNYYLRTAQTTQGIGVVMKRDFDNIFPLFGHRDKHLYINPTPADSTKNVVAE